MLSSQTKHILAEKYYEIGRSVLVLSALGILTKLLNIDLSKLEILGVTFDPASSRLIPGLIGLALIYAYSALVVSRAEAADFFVADPEEIEKLKNPSDTDKARRFVSAFFLPFSIFAYSGPLLIGALSIALLFGDVLTVLSALWSAL
jgi:hypothetical protein